ncbi:MAG: K(+)-transporting ATPase subunit F [Armatimonadota bacterium]
MIENILLSLMAFGLLCYLGYALLFPERL